MDKPRLSIFRSLRHIYAQVIDDEAGNTLVSASTLDANLRSKAEGLSKGEQAKLVGEAVARKALEKGIQEVVFDRGGYSYHGRVRSVAEAARSGGLVF
jgi:large subunit ribosomal protein L18